MLIEVQKVGSLNQLIGKFGKRHTVTFAIEAFFDGIHHVIDGNALADFADELEERVIFHPVVVVDHFGCIGGIRFEIDQVAQLTFDRLLIVAQGLFVEQVTLERFTRRVTDHTGRTTDQKDRFVAATLKMFQNHDADQVADMQRIGSGVNTHIGGRHLFGELLFGSGHHIMQHAPPLEFFYKIHRMKSIVMYISICQMVRCTSR